jgi:hypothetical protein
MKQTLISSHFFHSKQAPEFHSQKHKKILDTHLYPSLSHNHLPSLNHILIPSQIPRQLSQKTLKTLSSLNILTTQPTSSPDDVLNTISAREKFSDLLKKTPHLPLPHSYKRLLKIQESLDINLNNARIYGMQISFVNLQSAISASQNIRVTQEHVQQILFLCPNFYSIVWKNDQFCVDFPESGVYQKFVLQHRCQVLSKELYNRVKEFHNSHLERIKVKFDPETNKTWHSSFNLHSLPDIQLGAVPERPNLEVNSKVSVGKQLRATRLIVLCRVLIKIFNRMQTPSLFLKSLVKLIQKEKWTLEAGEKIEEDLVEVQEIFDDWIKFVQTESGKVVRVNKQAEFCLKSAWKRIKIRYYA